MSVNINPEHQIFFIYGWCLRGLGKIDLWKKWSRESRVRIPLILRMMLRRLSYHIVLYICDKSAKKPTPNVVFALYKFWSLAFSAMIKDHLRVWLKSYTCKLSMNSLGRFEFHKKVSSLLCFYFFCIFQITGAFRWKVVIYRLETLSFYTFRVNSRANPTILLHMWLIFFRGYSKWLVKLANSHLMIKHLRFWSMGLNSSRSLFGVKS